MGRKLDLELWAAKLRSGEWRALTFNSTLFASDDFLTWRRVGQQPGLDLGECPSLFPLPRSTPGAVRQRVEIPAQNGGQIKRGVAG